MGNKCDFSGWATKNDLKCSDGRTIRHGAFKDDDGKKVPLVWQHIHNNPDVVVGHAVLEHRDQGVYCYGYLNDSPNGTQVKTLIKNGDIDSLSIYANHLQQRNGDVFHGEIKEVSLVLAGANPGAHIDNIFISHSDGTQTIDEEEAIIFQNNGDAELKIEHADESKEVEDMDENKQEGKQDEKTLQDVIDTMNDEQKKAMYAIVGLAIEDAKGDSINHADEDSAQENNNINKEGTGMPQNNEKTIQDVIDTMNEEQKQAMYAVVGMAVEGKENNDMAQSDFDDYDDGYDEGGYEDMPRNVFENEGYSDSPVLDHSEIQAIFNDAKSCGSLKDAVLAHTATYGIDDIDVFFPDAQLVGKEPELIKRQDAWVAIFMDEVHKSPFAKIKSLAANLTATEARAKGYVKGNLKAPEIIKALKRVTSPTTIYKKQQLDRDDILDITDFDTVAFIKAEMKMMLNEEVARACLIGDGRTVGADDKIDDSCIRPIYGDSEVYTIYETVTLASTATDKDVADAVIKATLTGREEYRGSGSPIAFVAPHTLTKMLLAQDTLGRRIYETEAALCSHLRVTKIVEAPVLEGATRTDSDSNVHDLIAIIVNPKDYNIGTDKGGALSMFDDFDIDYNRYKYLLETRMSGALIKPYSAIVIEKDHTSTAEG